jgi:hypothetical protein
MDPSWQQILLTRRDMTAIHLHNSRIRSPSLTLLVIAGRRLNKSLALPDTNASAFSS